MEKNDLMYIVLIGIVLFMFFGKGGCPCMRNSGVVEGLCSEHLTYDDCILQRHLSGGDICTWENGACGSDNTVISTFQPNVILSEHH